MSCSGGISRLTQRHPIVKFLRRGQATFIVLGSPFSPPIRASVSLPRGSHSAIPKIIHVPSRPSETIIAFQGRRFDQTLSAPFVKNGRYLQRNGHYAQRPVKFWTSVQRRAEELIGPIADPSVNYVMTEVVHCKSKKEVGVHELLRRAQSDTSATFCPSPIRRL